MRNIQYYDDPNNWESSDWMVVDHLDTSSAPPDVVKKGQIIRIMDIADKSSGYGDDVMLHLIGGRGGAKNRPLDSMDFDKFTDWVKSGILVDTNFGQNTQNINVNTGELR